MAYKVINNFTDKENKNELYTLGDPFPSGNRKVSQKRLDELSSEHPKYKVKFIKEVKTSKKEEKTDK